MGLTVYWTDGRSALWSLRKGQYPCNPSSGPLERRPSRLHAPNDSVHILHWQGKGLAPSQRWVRQQLPEHFAFWSPGPPDILLPTTLLLQLDALKVTCIYSSFYRAQHQFVSVVIHVQLLSKCSLGGATTFL